MNIFLIAALGISIFSVRATYAHVPGCFPKNNLSVSVDDKESNGMAKEKFLGLIAKVNDAYGPIVKEKGGILQIISRWDDPGVNAYSTRAEKFWQIFMFGGLARHPFITEDGLMMVVCHEMGHHLGGAPKFFVQNGVSWATNEGQADYFAALKCMKRVIEKDNNQAIVAQMIIDDEAKTKCEMVYHSENDIAICKRISMAGKSVAKLLGQFDANKNIDFTTPDQTVVTKMFDKHSNGQCRLDTYFNGALCDKSFTENFSEKNTIDGACIKRDGYTLGMRPLCWYKPSINEI